MRRGVAILALPFLFLPLASLEARPLPTRSIRELVLHAETIVLAEHAQENTPAPPRFKVREVLRGHALKRNDMLDIDPGLHNLQIHDLAQRLRDGRNLPVVEQALLFLGPKRGPRFEPIASGLRFWTRDHGLLVPVQADDSSSYVMRERRDTNWAELVRQTRADAEAVNDLFARKKLPPSARRNRALLEWVEFHRHEFGAPTRAEHPEKTTQGWGDLQTQVFQWVLDRGEPADCWSAVKLYAELNNGAAPPLHGPAFGSRTGRAQLLRIATAEDALEGDRLRALTLLGHPLTLWTQPLPQLPQVQSLDAKEQADLIDHLTPLLALKSAPLRAMTAHTLRRVSQAEVLSEEHPKSQRALPALVKAFRLEYPGEPRDEIAEAIGVLGGVKHWPELTGNPPGMVVLLRDLERRDKQVHFWLNLRPCGQVVCAQPTLLLERINQSQTALETKRLPLPVVNLAQPWSAGWDGSSALLVEFSVKDFKDGTWRATVQGTVGKDKDKRTWTAEPKTFVIEAPRKVNNGQPSIGLNW
ncbi:MAG TPA: hypothetical protein VH682_06490 [Gemmataceae bacterium]|jgi:hypothetical protein